MKLEIRKFSARNESIFNRDTYLKYGLPKFIYGDLIALELDGKAGCLNRFNPKNSIPFKYKFIDVAENGIIMAVDSTDDGLTEIDFYDKRGKYLANYSLAKTAAFYIDQDESTICCLEWEDNDEETYEITRGYMSILADGRVIHRMLADDEKKELWHNNGKPIYISSLMLIFFETGDVYSTTSVISNFLDNCANYYIVLDEDRMFAFENDAYGIDISLGNATKRRFFKTEEERDRYISNFENKVLNEILNIVEL